MRETLALIMPVYNESAVVGEVLSHWESMLGGLGVDYRIYAYNDGSKDNSLAILNAYAAMPGHQVTVIDQPNSGHGPTILRGYRECCTRYDWLFQLDSDDEIAPSEFVKLWELRADHDFVIGLRAGRQQNWARLVISKVSVGAAKLLYGCRVSDVNCPFRLMRSSAFAALFAEVPGDSFAPNVMLSSLASYHGLHSMETPVAQCNRRTGEVSIRSFKLARSAALSFWQLFSLRLKLMKYAKILRLGLLCFLLALVAMLIPERYEEVSPAPYSVGGITSYQVYEPAPWESIQQIRLDMVWRLKSPRIAPNDILFSLPNAGVLMKKQLFDQLQLPAAPDRRYHFAVNLFDDAMILRAAPAAAGLGPDELPVLLYNVAHRRFLQTASAQMLVINDDLIGVDELTIVRTVDSLLPKIIGAALAALGTGLLIAYLLKRFGRAPGNGERQKTGVVAAVMLIGLTTAAAMAVYYRWHGHGAYPYSTFLYATEDRFNDLFNTFTVMRFVSDPYCEPLPGSGYFPLTYLLLKAVPAFNQMYVIFFSFAVFLSFYLVSGFLVCCRKGWLAVGGLLAVLLLNYPLWFMLDRGNTDFLVYFFIFLFVWCYRNKHDWWAILFLICAVNLKLYPAILAVFFLKDRAYQKFFAAAIGSVAVFALSLGYFDWNLRGLLTNLQRYQECYVFSLDGVNCGHSLFGWFKLMARILTGADYFAGYAWMHTVLAAVLAALVSFYVIWVEKVFWKNLYLLLALMLLLPHVSLDYRMIVLVIPALYFLADDRDEKNWLIYSLFWGLLLMPIHWIGEFRGEPRQLSVFLRPLLLSALVLWIVIDGFWQRKNQSAVTISNSKSVTGELS